MRDELRRELGEAGVTVATSTLHRVFARHGITRKKALVRLSKGPPRLQVARAILAIAMAFDGARAWPSELDHGTII